MVQPDQMQVSCRSSGEKRSENPFIIVIYFSFLKDFQPHSDIDTGAHHGHFDLSSDQEMWPELHVSALRQRTHRNQPPTVQKETFLTNFF